MTRNCCFCLDINICPIKEREKISFNFCHLFKNMFLIVRSLFLFFFLFFFIVPLYHLRHKLLIERRRRARSKDKIIDNFRLILPKIFNSILFPILSSLFRSNYIVEINFNNKHSFVFFPLSLSFLLRITYQNKVTTIEFRTDVYNWMLHHHNCRTI